MKVSVAAVIYNRKDFLLHRRPSPVITGILALSRIQGLGLQGLESVTKLRSALFSVVRQAEIKRLEILKRYGANVNDRIILTIDSPNILQAEKELDNLFEEKIEMPDRFKLSKSKAFASAITPEEVIALESFVEFIDDSK